MEHPLWRSHRPPDAVVRSPTRQADRRAEQDEAAGGRERRVVRLSDGGTATASVRLLLFDKARRIYAYLHFSHEGHKISKYIGEATADSRGDALRIGWQTARRKGLLDRPIQVPTGRRPASRR
jgi:DNA mismatch endonuclease (patch repair protein)